MTKEYFSCEGTGSLTGVFPFYKELGRPFAPIATFDFKIIASKHICFLIGVCVNSFTKWSQGGVLCTKYILC